MLRPALTLSLALFANQTATLVLTPILVEVAADFDVSTATAGQLRAISGAVAGVTALATGILAGTLGLKRLMLAGLGALVLAVGASAAAPTFEALAAAQALLGVALALLLSAAVAGVPVWVDPGRRADALTVVFSGQAAAWVVGMPVAGALGAVSWRLPWALPLAAAVPAALLVAALPQARSRPTRLRDDLAFLRRDRVVRAWALGELAAYSAWTGMLVFSGALLVESYGLSLGTVGILLGAVLLAYFPGSVLARRVVDRFARPLLVGLAAGASVVAVLIGSVRPAPWATVALLAGFVLLNSGRTIAGSVFGLDAAPRRTATAMGVRASATQLGYLVGAGLGGAALHAGGYPALGATFAALYALAIVPHLLLAWSGAAGARSSTLRGR